MPPESPLHMPVQDLGSSTPGQPPAVTGRVRAARLFVWTASALLTGYGIYEMIEVVSNGGVTVVEGLFVAAFALTFAWISLAAATAVAGLLFAPPPLPPMAEGRRLRSLNALVMPVYNEDPRRTTAALQAMAEALHDIDQAHAFELLVLSDSNRADAWINESAAVTALRDALAGMMPVHYRRRWRNTEKKAGNIKDFVSRWGARYECMLVLDADSLMSASALVRLAAAMEDEPRLGILQTVPLLVGRSSLMARMQQFAGDVYGPVMARGLAAWAGDQCNYWGHNAIIRVSAFAAACGLPQLPGRRPFGGAILSHDFVEAALMCRAGWGVRMAPDLGGSYEESPPSLIDIATRDRRWAQGNIQHAAVVGARGLRWPSRAHLVLGILSYACSPLWMGLLLVGIALALQAHFVRPEYFAGDFQLFPTWPRLDAERMLGVFLLSMTVLLLPKLLALGLALWRRRPHAPPAPALLASVLVETVLAALYAPVLMLVQSRQLMEILTGRDSGWATQRRGEQGDSWVTAWRWHHWHMTTGLVMLLGAWGISPSLAGWLSPTALGLLLSVPLGWASGRPAVGALLLRLGLLGTAEERTVPEILARRDRIEAAAPSPPADALVWLVGDARVLEAHFALNGEAPAELRGEPDAARLTAQSKLADAASLDEALAWLDAGERLAVAGHRALAEALLRLPCSR